VIYLDANVIIRFVEGDPASRDPIRKRLTGEPVLVTSQLSRLECRCHPMRLNDLAVLKLYDVFFSSRDLQLLEITEKVVDQATDLRAQYALKTPDAIHLAPAIVAGATHFLTGDIKLSRCTQLQVEII
jgi:uncharacterized protein